MAAELAGWTASELPGQVTEQLASWPPGMPSAADHPPLGRVTSPRSYHAFITST